jgi:hypothetical protein
VAEIEQHWATVVGAPAFDEACRMLNKLLNELTHLKPAEAAAAMEPCAVLTANAG